MKFHRSIFSLAHWSLLVRERERDDKNMNRGISPLIVRVSLVTIETDVVFVWSLLAPTCSLVGDLTVACGASKVSQYFSPMPCVA